MPSQRASSSEHAGVPDFVTIPWLSNMAAPEDGLTPPKLSHAVVGLLLFAIDFEDAPASMAGVMRALLCVVNERRPQLALLPQPPPPGRLERAAFRCAGVSVSGTLSMTTTLE